MSSTKKTVNIKRKSKATPAAAAATTISQDTALNTSALEPTPLQTPKSSEKTVAEESSKHLTPQELFEISKCTYQRDNYVTEYKQNREVIKFLLLTAINALKSDRRNIIFEPIPITWQQMVLDSSDAMRMELLGNDKTIDLKPIITKLKLDLNLDTLMSAIDSSLSDLEIIEKLGEATYSFVKFVLMSNNTMIKPYSLLTSEDVLNINTDDSSKMRVSQSEMNSTVQQYKVIHTPLKEDAFKDADTFYLYHGTPSPNVFSIMRNGLHCGSKAGGRSKYFLNGNAHGDGMYFSNDINMSLGYSGGGHTVASSTSASTTHADTLNNVLFIFEVKKNPAKSDWHKSGNIYVVDDESAVILRFIINFSNAHNRTPLNQAIFAAINKKLNAGKIKELERKTQEIETRNITTIHNKRLMREFAMIKKQDAAKLGFNVVLAEEDNLKVWMVHLFRLDNPSLEEQMRRIGIPHIEIEITFKENYPIEPPFIRVVHPHFKFRSGHITAGGAFCMEMLTNQGWSPTLNVENVITQIKMAISDGGGEIDEAHWNTRYTKAEAIEAFKRVLATHGWV